MSDVADLFAKKKKKNKKKKGEKKSKKSSKSTSSSGIQEEQTKSTTTSSGWTSTTTQYKSIMGSKAPTKLKKTLAVEQTEEDVKFEGMSEKQYNKHVEQDTSKKDFHKARLLADAKKKMNNDDKKPETIPQKALTWREKMAQRKNASSTNITNQIGSASHFPSLGSTSTETQKSSPAVGAPQAPSGAWGTLAEDEDIKREVQAVLLELDPEVIRQREIEAEKLRIIELEKKNTWGPLEDEGGIDQRIENSYINQKVQSMIKEYLNVGDIQEVILCIKEFRNPSKHGYVLQRIFEEAFERAGDEEQLMKIAKLIVSLRNEKKKAQNCEFKDTGCILTKSQVIDTVEFIGECMEDIKVDVPTAPERFEYICKHLKLRQVLPDTEKAFIASQKFDGAKDGYVFKGGANGIGYYLEKNDGKQQAVTSTSTCNNNSSKPSSSIYGEAMPVDVNLTMKPTTTGISLSSESRTGSWPNSIPGEEQPVNVKQIDDATKSEPAANKTANETTTADPDAGASPTDTGGSEEDLRALYGEKKKKKKKKKKDYVA